jgi:hypothetical protein
MPRRWVLKELPLDKDGNPPPFSGLNLTMAVLSTSCACEQLGLTRSTLIMDGYIKTITHPEKMIKGQ